MARFLKDRQKSQGAAPGSLIFIGQQKIEHPIVHITRYSSDEIKEYTPDSIEEIQTSISNDHITWINVAGLHDTEFIAQLGKIFNISPLILEDIVNTDQRSDYLCYTLLDTLVDSYIINLEKLGTAIEEEGKNIFLTESDTIKELYYFKTELSYIRKNVRPFKEISYRFINCDSPIINERTYIYLRDLDDLVLQAQEAIEIYYTMVSDQINLFQTNVSNKVNDVMKVLTIFSTIFIPLTFIAGIYGMNFEYIPELHYRPAYFILWGIMIVITVIMLFYFKRKKWF